MSKASAARSVGLKGLLNISCVLTAICLPLSALSEEAPGARGADPLRAGFEQPPASARPRVWWHWMNGNITKEGIRKDIEWMQRIGLGGFQIFDINLKTPQVVDQRLTYMHEDWQDAFRYAVQTAGDHGLDVAIAASPGWSETGGPWVPAEDGLKKVVWSETILPGGRRFTGRLGAPPTTTGPFQSLPINDPLAAISGDEIKAAPQLSGDIAVLAYPLDAPPLTASARLFGPDKRPIDRTPLLDADLESGVTLDKGTVLDPATLTYVFDTPQTVRSTTLYAPGMKSLFTGAAVAPVLQASADGVTWQDVAAVPAAEVPTTVSFPPATATHFRIKLVPQNATPPTLGKPAPGADMSAADVALGTAEKPLRVTEFRLLADSRISQFERKAGFAYVPDYYALDSADQHTAGADPSTVVDLSKQLRVDGSLDWTPPAGKHWRVVRMGWSLLGTTNHPAPLEATGLEVDKFDAAAVRRYMEHYLETYRRTVGAELLGKRGITAIQTDSIEVGAANWTPRMIEQFKRLRGYDPTPYLPALTGGLIGSRVQSDNFLYDYRRTLADLMASEHYGTVAAVGREHGLTVYGEALENGRPAIGDDMAMRSHTDVPMAAMWTFARSEQANPSFVADIKGAASVAHIYGQKLVAAEALTSAMNPWAHAPQDLRRVIDLAFVHGVNRPFIHSVVHQPVDDRQPGLSLSVFGQFFNRHETWAEMARPWIDYLARTSFLLQQGRHVADVAYFYGEEAPITGLYRDALVADATNRYGYDFIGSDALINKVSVADNELVAQGGARYRVLYLGGSSRKLTLTTLRRLEQLVRDGLTLVGPAPQASPALGEDREEWQRIVTRLWSGGHDTRVGAGRVLSQDSIEAALRKIGVTPDFEFSSSQPNSEVLAAHRRLADGELFFVTNRLNRSERITARFRVTGKAPELWRADTGTVSALSYQTSGDVTEVPLDFAPEESFFIVFRSPATAPKATITAPDLKPVVELKGEWAISFQPRRGAPASTRVQSLQPLNESSDPAIRYFSGVATYEKHFEAPRSYRTGRSLFVDLGRVGDVAEVFVNGRSAGTIWHAPWRCDIGPFMTRGKNKLEIKVANLWVNRLIGDQQLGVQKTTFTAIPTYTRDAPLRPSGLLGPVMLLEKDAR